MRAQECNRGISSLSGLFFTFHPAPSPPEEGEGSVEARGRRRWPPPNRRTPHCGSAEGIPSFFFCLGEARGWSGTRPGVRPDEAKRKTGCRWFSPGRVLQPGTLRPSPKREHGRALFPGRVSGRRGAVIKSSQRRERLQKGLRCINTQLFHPFIEHSLFPGWECQTNGLEWVWPLLGEVHLLAWGLSGHCTKSGTASHCTFIGGLHRVPWLWGYMQKIRSNMVQTFA